MQHVKSPGFVSFLYNHNPFYLISAGLVLYGIRTTLDSKQASIEPWMLAGLIAAYTILLALTAWLIVRIGQVWDDARSILMVLLLLFFALSVSFDYLCISAPLTAVTMLGSGFCFTVLVTETLLRSLKIKFPSLFRLPFYLMLAVSFFYPLLITFKQVFWADMDTRWLLAGFPLVSAGTILCLVAAVRKTASYVDNNGTPWTWPMFPFSVFLLLIIGLTGRSALLCMAFDPSPGVGSIFGSYFTVPVFLAVMLLLLEIGMVEQRDGLCAGVMLLCPVGLLLSLNWSHEVGQDHFVRLLSTTFGTPFWLTLVALAALYGYAAIRAVRDADWYGVWPWLALVMVRRTGGVAWEFDQLVIWPCCVLAAIQLASAKRRSLSWRWLTALVLLSVPIGNMGEWVGPTWVAPIAFHWVLLGAVAVGFWFSDRFAIHIRIVTGVCLPVVAALYWGNAIHEGNEPLAIGYASTVAICAAAVGWFLGFRLFIYAAWLTTGVAAMATLVSLRGTVAPDHYQLLLFGTIGMVCFCVGVLVSCLKAGLAARFQDDFHGLTNEIRNKYPVPETVNGAPSADLDVHRQQ